MRIDNNNLEISFGNWNSGIILHENNKYYHYNYFMQYWEDSKNKFYRWLNEKDIKDLEKHKECYYNTLEEVPF